MGIEFQIDLKFCHGFKMGEVEVWGSFTRIPGKVLRAIDSICVAVSKS